MNISEFFLNRQGENTVVTCPNCGGDHYESNRFDEAESLYREAAREVPLLVFEGRQEEARDVLIAFYAVHIENLLRPAHICQSCGVSFDG